MTTRAVLVYDGECPFCRNYVQLMRLRDTVGNVDLVDARHDVDLAHSLAEQGLDIDEGMVLMMDGEIFHGADCVERIALLSTPVTPFNRANRFIFRHHRVATVLYPVLRAGRNAFLRLAGIPKILSKGE